MADKVFGTTDGGGQQQATAQQQQQAAVITAGSVFGVDPLVATALVPLDHGTPATGPGMPRFEMRGLHLTVQHKGTPAKPPKTWRVVDALAAFHAESVPARQAIADQLEAAGYLSPLGKGRRRKPQDVYSAYKSAVIDAARSGKTITETLDEAAAAADESLTGAPVPTIRVSNPADLRAGIKEVFRKALGEGPDEAGLDRMIAAYQGKEITAATQAMEGGVVAEPPSLATFADDQAKRQDPTRYDSRKVVTAVDVLARMLRGESVA